MKQYRQRYVLIRPLFGFDVRVFRRSFIHLFGNLRWGECRIRFYEAPRGMYVIRVNLECLDEVLTTIAYLKGIVVERISGTLKTIKELLGVQELNEL